MLSKYVAAKLRFPEKGDNPDTIHRIKVLSPRRCDHKEAICKDCLHSWQNDWELLLQRTASGRDLLGQTESKA
jgi:hypothetical protein